MNRPSARPLSRRVGPDRLTIGDDRLVIHSPADMRDWDVREHRRPLIHFDGRTWRLDRKAPCGGDAIRYELKPWSPSHLELPGVEIRYGPDYVARRERERALRARRDRIAPGLGLISPLIGFLGSRAKRRIEQAYGINAATATVRSLYLQYLVILLSIAWSAIGLMAAGIGGVSPFPVWPAVVAAGFLTPDALVRWGRLLEEESYPSGLYEWLWRS
jgi:hypothetical protein